MREKQKSKSLILIAVVLIITIIASTILGLYAWARYRSSKPGNADAQVAKWNFKLRAGETQEEPPRPFAITRTDGFGDVATDKLAPGTFGEIPIFVDMTGTEVLAKLDLSITITDCPRNVKFYATEDDRDNNTPMEFEQSTNGDNKYVSTITVVKYYRLSTVSDVHNETIYWKWAYETKDETGSATQGDQYDKEDSQNDAQIAIKVTGTQVTEIPPESVILTEEEKLAAAIKNPYDDSSIVPSPQDMFIYEVTGETLTATFASNIDNNADSSIRIASTDGIKIAETTKTYGTARITDFNIKYFKNLCGSTLEYKKVDDLSKFDGKIVIPATTIIDGEEYIITSYDITMLASYSNFNDNYGNSLNKVITSVNFPKTLKSIGENAFYSCKEITGITIPNGMISIGNRAFEYCEGLKGNLTISDSVISIGERAFYGCKGLTGSLTIGNSVTSIGNNAFKDCSGLTGSLTIGNSVTSIGGGSFNGCSGLAGSLIIPDSVTSIGAGAFDGCSGLTGNLTVPDSVTSIGGFAFEDCSGLTGNLKIGNGITSIESYTFKGCSNLTGNLIIPNGVTGIGSSAFEGCSRITSLTIPNSVTGIGVGAFKGCSGLTGNLTIPDSMTNITETVFYGCRSLESITIPNSVTFIGVSAFEGCSGLTGNITIPKSVTAVGKKAFYGCSKLESISVEDENTVYCSSDGMLLTKNQKTFIVCPAGKKGNVTIPSSVKVMSDSSFSNCSKLTGNITIPNNVTKIGNDAFYGCTNITSITISGSVTSIGNNAFSECRELASMEIPNNVTSIGNFLFYGCSKLTNVTIPNSITNIGMGTFMYCNKLTSITIPDSVTSIGERAFERCDKLTSINVGTGNTAYCSIDGMLLTKDKTTLIVCPAGKQGNVTIPNVVTNIGNKAFYYCRELTDITIPNSVTSMESNVFEDCRKLTIINVEHESKPDGLNSDWSGGNDDIVRWNYAA